MNKLFLIPFYLSCAICSFAQNKISRKQAIQDIDYYVTRMRASHYDPAMYISVAEYDKRLNQIKKQLKDPLSIKELILTFYQITALLGDAHSTPQIMQSVLREQYGRDLFFPYRLVHHNGKVYIPTGSSAALGIPAGSRIMSINGISIRELLAELRTGMAGTAPFREEVSCRLLSNFLFLKNVQPPFRISYTYNGKRRQTTLAHGTSFRQALATTIPHIVQPYTGRILSNNAGYLDIRTLSTDINQFRQFLDSCFRQFKQAGVKTLIIDLRQNSGGNTDLGDLLFSYLTNKPYSWGVKSWRISEVYKDFLKANGDSTSEYMNKPNGSIWEDIATCLPKENTYKQQSIFDGKVFFITGPFTFSSAMAMADVVRNYKIGTLVGQPTGENKKDFGEAFTITLPNSGIRIQSTSSFSSGSDCKSQTNEPVMPDILIEKQLSDEIREEDTVLQYLLHHLK